MTALPRAENGQNEAPCELLFPGESSPFGTHSRVAAEYDGKVCE